MILSRLRRHARPLARFGCISVGTVYVLVGALALLALSGRLIERADEGRMIVVLKELPAGVVLVWAMIAGMAGYTVWRVTETLADPYGFGNGFVGLTKRAGVGLSGLGYGFLAFSAARIALDTRTAGDDSEQEQQLVVGQLFAWPGGVWLVGGIGVILLIVSAVQIVVLARRDYMIEIDRDALSPRMCTVTHVLAAAGYSARSVILAVLGYFLIRAARRHDPEAVGDTDTAFDFIGGGLVGDTAFALVALGTIAFGVYMYLCARYYRFERQ